MKTRQAVGRQILTRQERCGLRGALRRLPLVEAELLAAVAAGHESEGVAFAKLAKLDPLASAILRCERLEGEYAPANNNPLWGGGRDVIERIIGLCASAADTHADGISTQEGLGLGSGWCDVPLGADAPAAVDPAVGPVAGGGQAEYATETAAEYTTETAVCSVTGEPVLRTIAQPNHRRPWRGQWYA